MRVQTSLIEGERKFDELNYCKYYSLTARLHRLATTRQLHGGAKSAQLHWRRIVDGGEQSARGPHVPVQDVVLVTIAQCLEDLSHVVAAGARDSVWRQPSAQI